MALKSNIYVGYIWFVSPGWSLWSLSFQRSFDQPQNYPIGTFTPPETIFTFVLYFPLLLFTHLRAKSQINIWCPILFTLFMILYSLIFFEDFGWFNSILILDDLTVLRIFDDLTLSRILDEQEEERQETKESIVGVGTIQFNFIKDFKVDVLSKLY